MDYTPGDLVRCDFPYADLERKESRPALLLVQVFGGDFIACMVTKQANKMDVRVEITKADIVDGGLSYNPSYARPTRLVTISKTAVNMRVGKVHADKLAEVRAAAGNVLNPA